MKFHVRLFEEVWHKYEVEADDLEAAVELVKSDPYMLLSEFRRRLLARESAGELASGFLIESLDEEGDIDYENSTWRKL